MAVLVDHLKANSTMDDFLEGYPSVKERQVKAFLDLAPAAVGRLLRQSEWVRTRSKDEVN